MCSTASCGNASPSAGAENRLGHTSVFFSRLCRTGKNAQTDICTSLSLSLLLLVPPLLNLIPSRRVDLLALRLYLCRILILVSSRTSFLRLVSDAPRVPPPSYSSPPLHISTLTRHCGDDTHPCAAYERARLLCSGHGKHLSLFSSVLRSRACGQARVKGIKQTCSSSLPLL